MTSALGADRGRGLASSRLELRTSYICTCNKTFFLKNCLGQFACKSDTTVGHSRWFGKTTRSRFAQYVAIALRLDPFQILAHAC